MKHERTQGFAADPDYWKGEVFAYVAPSQNLKDLKDETRHTLGVNHVYGGTSLIRDNSPP
jgi:hypothetical protein